MLTINLPSTDNSYSYNGFPALEGDVQSSLPGYGCRWPASTWLGEDHDLGESLFFFEPATICNLVVVSRSLTFREDKFAEGDSVLSNVRCLRSMVAFSYPKKRFGHCTALSECLLCSH